ncbi:MAG: DUF697 domain-containing protein [Candidatus Accumulibacter sp.]|nr:DUF697 domain-containing protein [Accumulibacter sp.]
MSDVETTLSESESTTPPAQHVVDEIIRNRVYASIAVGLVPVPLVDLAAQSAIQTELLYRLTKVYNVPFKEDLGKKAVLLVLGTALPGLLTPSLGDLVRYIPVIGPSLSVASWPTTLGASTYALGQAFARHFASGGTLLDCDFDKLGAEVKSGFDKSKETVKGFIRRGKGKDAEAGAAEAVPA